MTGRITAARELRVRLRDSFSPAAGSPPGPPPALVPRSGLAPSPAKLGSSRPHTGLRPMANLSRNGPVR
jgi:hypothetical protein